MVNQDTSKNEKGLDKGEVRPNLEIKNDGKFPIVGLGASAGGLEAFESFFDAMPEDSNIAFVLVAHLAPSHTSLLPDLVQQHTGMHVQHAQNGMRVKPNNVYVIPPNKDISIENGNLVLLEVSLPRTVNLPIDNFLRALARDQGGRSVAVILSGTGSDGSLGIKAIKGEGGLVLAQDEKSAKYNGMPSNAVATGLVDYVLPPKDMPEKLEKYLQLSARPAQYSSVPNEHGIQAALKKIYAILRNQTGHDFSQYKKNTLYRRIERRMNIHEINNIKDYVKYLEESENEGNILFKELLIGVTNFFRDPDAFDSLLDNYLPSLLETKPDQYRVRVWVAGCSTGEEAYSLAITLQKFKERFNKNFHIQIFATDIDDSAIDFARNGLYSSSILSDVGLERISRYFSQEDDGLYRVRKSIREMIVFAPQNIVKDPPFTKLDLLSCRNLMIYFGSDLQKKMLSVFHYSLKPNGILFLGSSESIGKATNLFTNIDKKWKIFRRNTSTIPASSFLDFPTAPVETSNQSNQTNKNYQKADELNTLQLVESILQQTKTPPCVIIDEAHNVVYIHGKTGRYLEPAEGKVSVNILEMARQGLRPALASGIRKVKASRQELMLNDLQVEFENSSILVDVIVKPIFDKSSSSGLIIISFSEKENTDRSLENQGVESGEQDKRTREELERELQYTTDNLQTTIEELETSNEELKSTNEELQSTNEELQSTNEEMETSKEELQSLNEESVTVNAELQSRIDQLSKSNDDMKNLLDSTNIATLFLDSNLCIRRFTPSATKILPLSSADSGRPIEHFATKLIDLSLVDYGKKVLEDLSEREIEVHSIDHKIYIMKVRPYRTTNNVIDGVVITFIDNTERIQAVDALTLSETRYRMFFELANDSVVVINGDTLKFEEFNQQAFAQLGYTREEFSQASLADIENKQVERTLSSELKNLIETGKSSFKSEHLKKDGTAMSVQIKAKTLPIDDNIYLLCTWQYLS